MVMRAIQDPRAHKRAQRIIRRRLQQSEADYMLTPLAGDASTRHYFRISFPNVLTYTTAVLMLFDRPFHLGEFDYYQVGELLRKINLPVAAIYEVFESDGAMLIEDLGDMSLQQMVTLLEDERDAILEIYRRAVDSLVLLQARAGAYSHGVRAFERAFDEEKLGWELRFMMKHFASGLLGFKVKGAALATLKKFFTDLCARISELPRVLCHRDYHSRNLMVRRDQLFIIDFQDARMGPFVYDLVSLLRDSYVELPAGLRTSLLEYYVDKHPDFGPVDQEMLMSQFNLVALQRHLKHLGTFGYQVGLGRRQYLRFVPLTLSYLEQNLQNFPEYAEAAKILLELFGLYREKPGAEG